MTIISRGGGASKRAAGYTPQTLRLTGICVISVLLMLSPTSRAASVNEQTDPQAQWNEDELSEFYASYYHREGRSEPEPDYSMNPFEQPGVSEYPAEYDVPQTSEIPNGAFLQSAEYQYPAVAGLGCQCAMFLVTTSDWAPEHKVFATGEQYNVNCSDLEDAEQRCRKYCEEENTSVTSVFSLHPEALEEYPPSSSVPCGLLPAPTATFYQSCSPQWTPLMLPSYSHVCCHPLTNTPAWCDAIPPALFEQPPHPEGGAEAGVEDRGLDLEKSPDDFENNEIEGSTKPEKLESAASDEAQQQLTWVRTLMKYFGYSSLGEMVQGFDIFALPQRFRKAVKTYRDEVNMGQCYMEFTTYSIFTKGENPFEGLIRTRRDAVEEGQDEESYSVLSHEEEGEEFFYVEEGRANKFGRSESKQAQIETIKSLVGSLVTMLERSDSTKRYASVIRQLLPVVTQVYAAEDPQQAVNTLVSTVLGPYLEKINGRKPKPGSSDLSSKIDKLKSKPAIPAPPASFPGADDNELDGPSPSSGDSGVSSQVTSMLLNFVRQYMGSYFNTLPGGQEKPSAEAEVEKIDDTENRLPQKQRPTRPLIPGNIMNLLNLFLGGASRPRPSTTPRTTTPPPNKVAEKNDNLTAVELAPPKDFVDVVLEVIRPVFISILGKAPGDSGVSSIREVSRLSVLGRVDDALAEEVLSPYFCLKTYGVNKAWSLTERGLRVLAKNLTPEERETFRALIV